MLTFLCGMSYLSRLCFLYYLLYFYVFTLLMITYFYVCVLVLPRLYCITWHRTKWRGKLKCSKHTAYICRAPMKKRGSSKRQRPPGTQWERLGFVRFCQAVSIYIVTVVWFANQCRSIWGSEIKAISMYGSDPVSTQIKHHINTYMSRISEPRFQESWREKNIWRIIDIALDWLLCR